jgi:hypothetical protein
MKGWMFAAIVCKLERPPVPAASATCFAGDGFIGLPLRIGSEISVGTIFGLAGVCFADHLIFVPCLVLNNIIESLHAKIGFLVHTICLNFFIIFCGVSTGS